MGKVLNNIHAVLHGLWRKSIIKITSRQSIIGKKLRLFNDATLNAYRNGCITIGNEVRIDSFSTIVCVDHANLTIGDRVGVGPGNRIICRKDIQIGANTIMGPNVMIYDHDHKFDFKNGVHRTDYNLDSISIGSNCWIGAGTIILKGAHIGDNCLIGAGCIVKGDIPNNSRIIQKRDTLYLQTGEWHGFKSKYNSTNI